MKAALEERIMRAALEIFARSGKKEVSVSELADSAGVARGTIYNNLGKPDGLFEQVASFLTREMNQAIQKNLDAPQNSGWNQDPAARIVAGTAYYLRRTHEEPLWGSFLCRFGISVGSLQELWQNQPAADIHEGVRLGRFSLPEEQTPVVVALVGSNVLAAMHLVREARVTWREAAAATAAYILCALGLNPEEARSLTTRPELLET